MPKDNRTVVGQGDGLALREASEEFEGGREQSLDWIMVFLADIQC